MFKNKLLCYKVWSSTLGVVSCFFSAIIKLYETINIALTAFNYYYYPWGNYSDLMHKSYEFLITYRHVLHFYLFSS